MLLIFDTEMDMAGVGGDMCIALVLALEHAGIGFV